MREPHKHAEVIKAWADGAEIQFCDDGFWFDTTTPSWLLDFEYRIKPEPKPDTVLFGWVSTNGGNSIFANWSVSSDNLKLTFDGETGKLKSAEVIK